MEAKTLTTQMIKRMPLYLSFLKSLPKERAANISATTIAHELRLNDVQVRKDLAQVSGGGRPKVGYVLQELIRDLEHCLGYDNVQSAVLIGAGSFGQALLAYEGFLDYGMDIIAAFDEEEHLRNIDNYKNKILPLCKLPGVCSRMKIKIGIITVDAQMAQKTCDMLVDCGIKAIWNFTSVHLQVSEQVLVKNENLASSLAILSNHLAKQLYKE
jgi:redox-sensing transcriptional repressor